MYTADMAMAELIDWQNYLDEVEPVGRAQVEQLAWDREDVAEEIGRRHSASA